MSEETKFTTGPYTVERNHFSTGFYVWSVKERRQLAVVNQKHAGIEAEESEANAHLYAAAPDLYAACVAARLVLLLTSITTGDRLEAIGLCNAAIAKATNPEQRR